MDPPSDDHHLSPSPTFDHAANPERAALKRHRSHSFSDDTNVLRTNDDATECKKSAVAAGYWSDEFISVFCAESPSRRDPEINRGYWARVKIVRTVVDKFLQKTGSSAQIVNLGCGYDTLYWQLKLAKHTFRRFVDVDFSSVTAKKIHHIMKPAGAKLKNLFANDADRPLRISQHANLSVGDYALVGADLRQLNECNTQLINNEMTGLDVSLPTLFISECVLIYMDVQSSANLLQLMKCFPHRAFLNYEQVNLNDKFGQIMLKNLRERGIVLAGSGVCDSVDTHIQRFTSNSWPHARCLTVQDIYEQHLSKADIRRIESLEALDEGELLSQLLEHYSFTFAAADKSWLAEMFF